MGSRFASSWSVLVLLAVEVVCAYPGSGVRLTGIAAILTGLFFAFPIHRPPCEPLSSQEY